MVVKIMGWRAWPSISCSRKFKVNLRVHSLEGYQPNSDLADAQSVESSDMTKILATDSGLMIQVNWKGSNTGLGNRFRRNQKRARTSEKALERGHSINFQEDFEHVCVLAVGKDGSFLPFDVQFGIIQVDTKSKATMFGNAVMNLGELAPSNQEVMKLTKRLRIIPSDSICLQKHVTTLVVSVIFSELRPNESVSMERFETSSPLRRLSGPLLCDQQIRVMSSKKMKDMKRSVFLNLKKTSAEVDSIICNNKTSTSEESSSDSGDIYDTESIHDSEEENVLVGEEDTILQSYGPLAGVNLFVEGAIESPKLREHWHVDEMVSPCLSSNSYNESSASEMCSSDSDHQSTTRRSLLSWKRRRLSFRSQTMRGEPLLNKEYGENGGDDIDRDRRLSGYPIEPCCSPNEEKVMLSSAISECLDSGADLFSIGSWEKKDLVSRDGNMSLSTSVFFASIDQRSERAAGESACTPLVAVIAEWLHKNPNCMPIKAELDMLIREGAAEWRNLFDIEAYRSKFVDGHFDLETVVDARIRPLVVDHERSFIGFFQPEGLDETYTNVLEGAKSFDEIWACIEQSSVLQPDGSTQSAIYIVSWNDHFFILKVCKDAYYIIDTLGERLFEGCNQAYILQFDDETRLSLVSTPAIDEAKKTELTSSTPGVDEAKKTEVTSESSATDAEKLAEPNAEDKLQASESDDIRVVYRGKDACKEFVKGFFAALPIRELQTDLKKGLLGNNALHQRLQIEFNFTALNCSMPYCNGKLIT